MRRSIALASLLATIALLLCSSWLTPNRSVSAGQGKGGEVIAKPTPTPAPKKPASNRPKTGSRTPRSNTGVDELAFWETIKNSTDPEDFKAYLEQYPKGKFATLAKNRLKNLESKNGSTASPSSTPIPVNPNSGNPASNNPPTTNPGPATSGPTNSSTTSGSNSASPDVTVPAGETKDDAPRHFSRAQTLSTYDRVGAENEYRIATRLDPNNGEYFFELGYVLIKECKYVEAEVALKEAIRIGPDLHRSVYVADILEYYKRYDESEAVLREAARVDPGSYYLDRLGSLLAKHNKWAEADKEYRELIRRDPWNGHYSYGSTLAKYHRYAEAELEMREAIRSASENYVPLSHHFLGRVLAAEKKWSEAEAEMRECLRTYFGGKDTQDTFVKDLAKLYEDQGKLAEADNVYQEAVRSFPTKLEIRARYGEWLLRQKRWTDAEADYREAVRLANVPATAKHYVGDAYAGLGDALRGQNKLTEADGEYRKALHIDAYNVRAHRGLSDCLEKQNRLPEAEAAYRAMVKAGCDSAPAHADYADFLVRQKRWKEAEAEYKTALDLDPQNTEYPEKLKAAVAAQKK